MAAVASTLGQVAAETKKGQYPRRQAGFLIVGGLLLLGVAGGLMVLKSRPASPPPGPSAPLAVVRPPVAIEASSPSKTLPPPERTINWSIVTTPPGATLVDTQGVPLGETPWMLGRPVGAGTQTVRLRKTGFADKLLILKLDADEERHEKLEPLRGPSPKKQSTGSVAPTKSPPPPSQAKKDLYID
jgi:hypothetical protein